MRSEVSNVEGRCGIRQVAPGQDSHRFLLAPANAALLEIPHFSRRNIKNLAAVCSGGSAAELGRFAIDQSLQTFNVLLDAGEVLSNWIVEGQTAERLVGVLLNDPITVGDLVQRLLE